jgi:hypothetical protein
MTKMVSIGDFLTPEQGKLAVLIYRRKPANLHRELLEQVIRPNIAEINRKLGQENDPDYLAYGLEYALVATR